MSDDYQQRQDEIRQAIAASPLIGQCAECGDGIRQAELDFGLASNRECAQCTRDAVVSMIGDF